MKSVLRPPKKRRPPEVRFDFSLEDSVLMALRVFVLEKCCWNRTLAAEVLGISVRSLRQWMAIYEPTKRFPDPTARCGDVKLSRNLLGEFYAKQSK